MEAGLLVDALRDRGLATWRDLDDLASEPTEQELVAALTDADTAGAVMLVTPEVADSDVIRNVEAFRIFRRHGEQDGFIVKPVLINVGYGDADATLGHPAGFQDLGDWNLHKVDGLFTEPAAIEVARAVLQARLELISTKNPDSPLDIGLFSRRVPDQHIGGLRFEFTPHFEGRVVAANAYSKIETSLVDAASAIAKTCHSPIQASGFAALPLGVLFGAVFSPLAGFQLRWRVGRGENQEVWQQSDDAEAVTLNENVKTGDAASEDVVLAIGISAHIEQAVAEYLAHEGMKPRGAIHVALDTGSVPQGHRLTPSQGLSVVNQAIDAVRRFKDDYGMKRGRLHLFLACPLGMSVMLGQRLNTLSGCVLYEHDPSQTPAYHRVHEFNPSGYTYR